MVFYETRTISWVCVEAEVEEHGVGEPQGQPKSRFHSLGLMEPEKIALIRAKQHLLTFHTHWTQLLAIYTGTKLAKPSDKPVAIKGVISWIGKSAPLNSLAGLCGKRCSLQSSFGKLSIH
jgi:hypothetical protein